MRLPSALRSVRGRCRLLRMLLCENLVLASIAGLASLYLTYRLPLFQSLFGAASTELNFEPDWKVYVHTGSCQCGVSTCASKIRRAFCFDVSYRRGVT